jgi:hypothetical protein
MGVNIDMVFLLKCHLCVSFMFFLQDSVFIYIYIYIYIYIHTTFPPTFPFLRVVFPAITILETSRCFPILCNLGYEITQGCMNFFKK